jgi:A/G-specific adenine glycosylase
MDRPNNSFGVIPQLSAFVDALLDWYDKNARALPWRISPADRALGIEPDPYSVWLSEIMLQQTTVKAVGPYFAKFVNIWPNVSALAKAKNDDVMAAWAGLGYYSRARNLKLCAETIASDYSGRFPQTKADLIKLSGIGDYTASAIAAIAFDERVAVVDGNVERVVSRQLALKTPLPQAKPIIRDWLQPQVPKRSGDFAQAMMDLGATICSPRSPACAICPVGAFCAARGNSPEQFPAKLKKAAKPERVGAVFVAIRDDGAIWLERRPDKGLLGGMAVLPTTDWSSRKDGATTAVAAPFAASWIKAGAITHVFTHFTLTLQVFVAEDAKPSGEGWWSPPNADHGLPSVMQKALQCVLQNQTR